MALNLIKVTREDGEAVLVGVTQIVMASILSPGLTELQFVNGTLKVKETPNAIFDLANRRPPDGN